MNLRSIWDCMGQEPGFRTRLVEHEAKAERAMYSGEVPTHAPPQVHHHHAGYSVLTRAVTAGSTLEQKSAMGSNWDPIQAQKGPY